MRDLGERIDSEKVEPQRRKDAKPIRRAIQRESESHLPQKVGATRPRSPHFKILMAVTHIPRVTPPKTAHVLRVVSLRCQQRVLNRKGAKTQSQSNGQFNGNRNPIPKNLSSLANLAVQYLKRVGAIWPQSPLIKSDKAGSPVRGEIAIHAGSWGTHCF